MDFITSIYHAVWEKEAKEKADKTPAKAGDLIESTYINPVRGTVKSVDADGAVFYEVEGSPGTYMTSKLGHYRKVNILERLAQEASGDPPPGLFDAGLRLRAERERREQGINEPPHEPPHKRIG